MAGIYIHIPFCKNKCVYCDFYSTVCTPEQQNQFVRAVKNELSHEKHYIGDSTVSTIYFGGGTPSLLQPQQIQEIIETVKSLWDCSGVGEITVEANPDDLSKEYLGQLADTDVNRLSIGIQSFSERNLQFMNRRHDAKQAIEAVGNAREAGFGNITIDLIYGIPDMSAEEWLRNIEQAVALDVEHISAYHLTVEESTGLGKMMRNGKFSPVEEQVSEEQYLLLHQTLTRNGFEHYEISNFARKGFRAVHNSSYWSGEQYLGIGPSAHSYNRTTRRRCGYSLDEYLSANGKDIDYETEILTKTDKYNEYVMTSLRRIEGIDTNVIEARFGQQFLQTFADTANNLTNKGMLLHENERYYIPPDKFLLSDHIISELFVVG